MDKAEQEPLGLGSGQPLAGTQGTKGEQGMFELFAILVKGSVDESVVFEFL